MSPGSGLLFRNQAKTRFMTLTMNRYNAMEKRLAKRKLAMVFTVAELREWILDRLGYTYDGAVKCWYCGRVCDLADTAIDHKVPLDCGGWWGLDNLDLPCAACNAQKGEMTPEEFHNFLKFLEEKLPRARIDILQRLQSYSKLMANLRQAELIARSSEKKPKKQKLGKPPLIDIDF